MKRQKIAIACIALASTVIWSCSQEPKPTESPRGTFTSAETDSPAVGGSSANCSITLLQNSNFSVVYNEADCSVTFSWNINAQFSDPCRAEVFWGQGNSDCWGTLPFHDVADYRDDGVQTVTISVAETGLRRIKFRCRSMSINGTCWVWFPNDLQYAWCGTQNIDPFCEPLYPCEICN